MNILKSIILSISFIFAGLLAFQAQSTYAATDPLAGACAQAPNSALCKQDSTAKGSTENPAAHAIGVAATIIATVSAVIAVFIIIIAGLSMVTSNGNSEAVSSARNRIIYAAVGLIIIALAWSITTYFADHLIK